MPNLLKNTAAPNATTSNQGTKKMPKLEAKFHFFLEDAAYTQLPTQAFGVLSDDEFRTTSLVSVSAKKIISIYSGQVFLQPSNGTG